MYRWKKKLKVPPETANPKVIALQLHGNPW